MQKHFLKIMCPTLLLFLAACNGSTSNPPPGASQPGAPQPGTPTSQTNPITPTAPTTPTDPTKTPAPPVGSADVPVPLAWEASKAGSQAWSTYLYTVLESETPALLAGSSDVTQFCPKYASLSTDQKVNFWGMLISGIAKYESGFDPLNRYKEGTLGTDGITGQPVYSEGLLQLSYQDIEVYSFCKFNWSIDKYLSPTDPTKTILNPDINLACGAQILNSQVARHGVISIASPYAYWSTLEPSGKYTQVAGIKKLTNALPFCH